MATTFIERSRSFNWLGMPEVICETEFAEVTFNWDENKTLRQIQDGFPRIVNQYGERYYLTDLQPLDNGIGNARFRTGGR